MLRLVFRTIFLAFTLFLFVTAISRSTAPEVRASESAVTFSRQIAPILYTNCAVCHHTGGSGPFPLTSYPEAKRWATLLKQVTQSRYMPPWLPGPGHGDFAGARRLTDDQIALIGRWVDTGSLEGDPTEAPPPPKFSADWQLGPPDLVLEVDSATQVPASGTDLFRNFILPVNIQQTRWVRAMEIKPGSPQVVHHANLLIDRTASLRRAHPTDWKDGIPGMDINVDAGESFDPDSHFLNWKPDSTALVELPDMPWRLDPGNDLVLNEHLKPTGKIESVRARVGLYFTPHPATRFPILLQLEHDSTLDIPPGDAHFIVEDQLRLPEPVDVLAVYPHAHYLGHRLEGFATLPNGDRKDLILIPAWDIDRQSIYRFATPISLPAGSIVHMRYEYDNSAANPHNPHSPPIRVHAGNRSGDEMGHLWLQVLPQTKPTSDNDPRVPLMRAWMESRLVKSPNDPEALFNLGSLDLAANDAAQATILFRKAIAATPPDSRPDVRIAVALGSSLYKQGDWQQARAQFQSAINTDPTYADAHLNLAILDLKYGAPVEAEQQFHLLLGQNSKDVTALAGLGSALLAQNRSSEAQHCFEQALQLDPDNFDVNYDLATVMVSENHLEKAVAYLHRASDLRPAELDSHRGLVALSVQTGHLSEALQEQQTILALAPTLATEWDNLGVLQAQSGDSVAARQSFKHALRLDPANTSAASHLAHLP